jgi:peroxidase
MATNNSYSSLKNIIGRNADGTGNNIKNPEWGSSFEHFIRVTPNSYADGKSVMQDGPVARTISDKIYALPAGQNGAENAAGLNSFFDFFGQFITHDVTQSLGGGGGAPIPGIPFGFSRTPSGLVDPNEVDAKGVRQPMYQETSVLDLGTVYGRTAEVVSLLRKNDGNGKETAYLLTNADGVLPSVADVAANSGKSPAEVAAAIGVIGFGPDIGIFIAAGDDRINQTPGLISHHTIWMQEHNHNVDKLYAKHPDWSQDKLFEAARALTEAEFQNVVYNEYLPKLLGEDAIKDYKGYKSTVNPDIINEWASVAFRFGHDMSSNFMSTMKEDGTAGSRGTVTLGEAFGLANAASALRTSADADEWIRGLVSGAAQEVDGKVVDGNRNQLFGIGLELDLTVIDIMRGRDHGVGLYNVLRDGLGFKKYTTFEQFAKDNKLSADVLAALKDVYGNDINKLDSVVGGLLEKNYKDSQLGETFTKLNVMQFENMRNGDRFYFENRFKGDKDLIEEIEDTTMADILHNTTGIEHIYHDAFMAHKRIGGTEAGEAVNGTAKGDLIIAKGGDDMTKAGKGDDDYYGGYGNDTAYGEDGDDRLYGEDGNDYLYGDKGEDYLSGGKGYDYLDAGKDNDEDVFVFDSYLSPENVDTVKNFDVKRDEIHLEKDVFAALKHGDLDKSAFHVSTDATIAADQHDRIIYQSKTGYLYYDADGKGGAEALMIAQLDSNLKLTHQDFDVA